MERKAPVTEQIEEKKPRENPFEDLTLSDILWPLISIAVLIVLVIFVYIPYGFEIPTLLNEGTIHKEDFDKKQDKYQKLTSVDSKKLTEVDTLLAAALPGRFDVSVLAEAIDSLATQNNLQSNDITLRDEPATGFQQAEQQTEDIKGLRSISGVFSFEGSLKNINNFMKALVTSTKLIVIEKYELRRIPEFDSAGNFEREVWNVDLTLKAYSFVPFTSAGIDEQVTPLPNVEDVKDILGITESTSEEADATTETDTESDTTTDTEE